MIFEISTLAAFVGFAVLSYGFQGYFSFSPRIVICNVFHQIKQRRCIHNVTPTVFPSSTRMKEKQKRSKRSKHKKFDCQGNENARKRSTLGAISHDSQPLTSKKSIIQPGSQDETPAVHRSVLSTSAAINQAEYDAKARSRMLYSTKKAKEPFTFKVNEFGGVVDTPYLKLLFLYKAVVKEIEITVTPLYKWKDEREKKLRMTPEIYFTSKDEMKFFRPVEVHLQTHYSSSKKKKPVAVEIERTEHCVPPNWLKIRDVDFHKGMIKFFMNQFCGIRAVCNSCQSSIMSTRISYSVSIRDSANISETERSFYLRVYTDTPDQHEQVLQEMDQDGYRRIHPTQKYTVRKGCDLISQLSSHGLHSTPPFAIVKLQHEIIMEAVAFKLQTLHGSQIITSDLPIQAHIAEILSMKTTDMSYSTETAPTCSSSVNLTINGGSMIQTNFSAGQVNQENIAPPVASRNVDTIPKDAVVTSPGGHNSSSNSLQSAILNAPALMHNGRPHVASSGHSACCLNSHTETSTVPKEIYSSEYCQPAAGVQVLLNGQPTSRSGMETVPKALHVEHPGLSLPGQGPPQDPHSAIATVPKSLFAGGNLQSISTPRQVPQSVQIHPGLHRAFLVTKVEETEPKSLWRSEEEYAKYRQSTPTGLQSQPGFHTPSPIPASGHIGTLRSLSSHSIPEAVSHPAFLVPVTNSHPGYTQTIGRGDFFRHRNSYQRSAFCRLHRNSSHPALSSFDFRPLMSSPTSPKEEEEEEESENEDQGLLFALPEEEQTVPVPCNPNTDYNDEVFKALANASSYNPPAAENAENHPKATQTSQPNPTQNQNFSPYQGRPSAISSGFGSGLTTRNASACTDAAFEASEPAEKWEISATIHEGESKVPKSRDQTRPRSVSMSDPRELAAKLNKIREEATKADQSTQTTPGKKSYSDALKMPGRCGPQNHSRAVRISHAPTKIPRPRKGKDRRNGARVKKL